MTDSNNNNDTSLGEVKSTLGSLNGSNMSQLRIEAERSNESKYKSMYLDMIRKHYRDGGFISVVTGSTNRKEQEENGSKEHYQDETKILQKAMESERNALIFGIVGGILAFGTLKYLPKFIIWRLPGGAKKLRVLNEAEQSGDKRFLIGNAIGLFVEATFSIWIGSAIYNTASVFTGNNDDAIKLLSEIPLVKGKSAVSNTLCNDWIDMTSKQIPKEFWENVKMDNDNKTKQVETKTNNSKNLSDIKFGDKGLHDEKTWRAIRTFYFNCLKRNAYEKMLLRKEQERYLSEGVRNTQQKLADPIALPSKVPDDILSNEEARQLVSDQNHDEVEDIQLNRKAKRKFFFFF